MKRVLFILGVLEDEDVDWLVAAGHRQEVATGDVLIREGQPSHALYLILSGQLVVSIARPQPAAIAQLSSGEVVGEMSFTDHLPPSATVTAAEPSVVLAIHWDRLAAKLQQDNAFSARFYRAIAILLSTRLRSTVRYLEAEYWQPISISQEDCAPDMAENMKLGGIRFDWLMRRLRDADVPTNWEDIS
jgi:CRP/FNR family cyclic AMP-dependent transcriptional regulator